MKNCPVMLLADFYKQSHADLYDKDTQRIYATWTPRTSRIEGVNKVVVFGFQWFIKKYLIENFNDNFFNRPKEEVIKEYTRLMKNTIGNEGLGVDRVSALHDLGYLPLKITAMEEGSLCPIKVPCLTIENTLPAFYWLPNFLETLMSMEIWKPMTSATIALEYRKILEKWAEKTCDDNSHIDFQGHDFSMRGMAGLEACESSGAGHLLSFKGTDTIPSIVMLENYYNADCEKELIGTSIPASEHSIMCCNSAFTDADDETREYNAYKRIITEVHPTGIVSIVSDTWNLWDVLTKVLPKLKPEIMNRDGKLVVRPDSGDPADIVCGINSKKFFDDYQGKWKPVKELTQKDSPYYNEINKGVIELLWETFGGTINEKGYKVLDPHIGCIYGDAITMERAEEICERLAEKGFASSNIVFGIGSYTYQMNTRDTFGFALKSTYAIKNNREVFLYKDPITDNGVKKSQKGRVWVKNNEGLITFQDGFCEGQEPQGNMLEPLFINGELLKDRSLSEIRQKLKDSVKESNENDGWVNSHFMYDLTGAI